MTIRRTDETIFLEDVCPVEDAEALMQELQGRVACFDWSGCTHLHTACFQVLLAARLPVVGTPANPELARWLAPLVNRETTAAPRSDAPETDHICPLEA
jgi:hypothetical protein